MIYELSIDAETNTVYEVTPLENGKISGRFDEDPSTGQRHVLTERCYTLGEIYDANLG